MKPLNRKSRLQWLESKKGLDYIKEMYMFTDREVKEWFDRVYPLYKDDPPFSRDTSSELPECLVCESEVRITWSCACGDNECIVDPNDPELEERLKEYHK